MTLSEVIDTVRGTLLEHARIRPSSVEEHHVLTRDLGFDSLAFLLTLTDLEQRLGFEYPNDRLDDLSAISVRELIGLVQVHRAQRGVEA